MQDNTVWGKDADRATLRPVMAIMRNVPIGIELWTVRSDVKRDIAGAVRSVAAMGYEAVEFFSTYLNWTLDEARAMRALLDDLGIVCSSTHNGMRAFTPEAIGKTIELNHILGNTAVIVASVPPVDAIEGWRTAAASFADVADRLRPHGLRSGFHNHQNEWRLLDGERPMDVIAARTPDDFILQFDVGPAVEAGADAVAWINAHPGRTKSLHCRDWSATRGYEVAFGEGDCPWPAILDAAATVGGAEYFLIEHGHGTPDEEAPYAVKGLANLRRMRD